MAAELGHSNNQKAANSSADQRPDESEYDDRQSMFAFTKEEQRVDTSVHDDAAAQEGQNTSDQRDLIKWTKALAIATAVLAFATFIVACVSVVGAIDTRRLAEAARDQANTAIDTEKRQLRAYVFVDDIGMTDINSIDGPEASVRIKNGGQTPAYKLRNKSGYAVSEYPPITPLPTGDVMLRRAADTASVSELGPGNTHSKRRRHRPVSPVQIAGLMTGTLAIYFFGEVRYTDAFNCDRWIRYRTVLGGPVADHFPQLVIDAEGNDTSDETAQDCLFKASQ